MLAQMTMAQIIPGKYYENLAKEVQNICANLNNPTTEQNVGQINASANTKYIRPKNPLDLESEKIFWKQWKRGNPIVVSEVSNHLNLKLWTPEAFSKQFGNDTNDIVDCVNNTNIENQPMKRFWD